ncbi:MAG: hypothetical protein HQL87_09020 [Magnetococcales bacterium]|nr:hypothetical protein [Magnetococcales bacterium]
MIISAVPLVWLWFGSHLMDRNKEQAQQDFVEDVAKRRYSYPRINGNLKSGTESDPVTTDMLKNRCFYLIAQDKKNLYVMIDPSIDYKLDPALDGISQQDRDKILEKNETYCNKQKNKGKKLQDCIDSKINEAENQLLKERTEKKEKLAWYANSISQSITTAQIPVDSLRSLYTFLRTDLNEQQTAACKKSRKELDQEFAIPETECPLIQCLDPTTPHHACTCSE